MRGELDGVAGICVLDRVLEQRVERVSQRLRIGEQSPRQVDVEPPGARGDFRPADEEIREERLDVDLLEHEALLLGLREKKQALDEMGADCFEKSVIYKDAAYDVIEGFIGEPLLP